MTDQKTTDHMIPADKVPEIIDLMNADLKTPAFDEAWGDGYDRAAEACRDALEALLPAHQSLADELRETAGMMNYAATKAPLIRNRIKEHSDRVETLEQERDDFADRAGELEQERDEARKDCEYLEKERDKAVKDRDVATGAPKVEAEVTSEAIDRYEALAGELAEARVLADEQAAEIARLRAREIPDGWRIAEHPEYGTVLAVESLDGDVVIRYINGHQYAEARLVSVHALSFRDEAPAPQKEMDAR